MIRTFRRRFRPLQTFFLWDILRDRQTRPIFAWTIFLLLLGTLVYHWFEGWSLLDSVYFCIVTLTTVGYGDLTPTTPVAKLFTIFYILNGMGILLAFIDRVTEVRRRQRAEAN